MKRNNKGFVLIETLIVSSVVLTTLVIIYSQFSKVNQNYSNSYIYNNINGIYSLRQISDFVKEENIMPKLTGDTGYIDISDCNSAYYNNSNVYYCEDLYRYSNIKTLLFTRNSKVYLYGTLSENNPYSMKLQKFVKTIDDSDTDYQYRLVAEFNDGTYATVPFIKANSAINNFCPTGTCDNGTPIYFDPEKNEFCSQSVYVDANSIDQNSKGCMRWYAFGDQGNDSLKLILDHNTVNSIPWIDTSLVTAKSVFDNDILSWNATIKKTARFLEPSEVSDIVGIPYGDLLLKYFENKSDTAPTLTKGTGTYRWLYSYLRDCESSGCDINDNLSDEGYWLDDYENGDDNDTAWVVSHFGKITTDENRSDHQGIRPVIVIRKSQY